MFCGLALDVGVLQLRKLQLQHAADAAALGAMVEKSRGGSSWVAAGKADAALNGFTDGVGGITITIQNPPTSGPYSGDTAAIQATVRQQFHTAFLVFLGVNYASPTAMAVAKGSPSPGCVYIMNTSTTSYPLALGSNSNITSDCEVYVDSTSKSIQVATGNTLSVTSSNAIKVQGGSGGALLQGSVSPSPTFGSTNENDPLSSVASPAFSSCTYFNKVVGSWLLGWLLPTYATLNPGTYCGGLTTYYSHITLNPGIYIFTGSSSLSNSTFTGTGVTFFLTQGGGSGYGNFIVDNVTATLSAPTTTSANGVAGIVIFADRNWVAHGTQPIQITNSTITTDGIWYALNVGIHLNASTLQGNNYIGFVTDSMALSQSVVTIPSPDYTSLPAGAPYAGGSGGGGIVQ
jgi:hypothetical protein